MVTSSSSLHAREIESLCADADFRVRVISAPSISFRKVRSYIGGVEALSYEEVAGDARVAIALGYYRALAYRFVSEVCGKEPRAWFTARRKDEDTPARHSKDRSQDLAILREQFPEFERYIPLTPLTQEEVISAAHEELYEITCSPGTDLHQAKLYGCYKTFSLNSTSGSASQQHTFGDLSALREGTVTLTTGTSNYSPVDFDNAERSAALNNGAFQSDEVFGPVILRIARHFVKVYGLMPTMYWIWEKLFYNTEYLDLLRVFGGDQLEETDYAAFRAMQQSLRRKLSEMDAELKNLSRDLLLRSAHDAMLTGAY